MKAYSFLLTGLLALAPAVKGQAGKNYLDLSFGPSFSLGQFSAESRAGGYAGTGGHLGLNYSRIKATGWGWALNLSLGDQGVKQTALRSWLSENGNVTFNDSSRWLASTLMGGAAYARRSGRFFADGRLMGGFFFGKAPYIQFPSPTNTDQRKFRNSQQECVGSLGVMTMLRGGYQLSRRIFVAAGADLVLARPRYIIREPADPENGQPAQENSYPITTCLSRIHISIGCNW